MPVVSLVVAATYRIAAKDEQRSGDDDDHDGSRRNVQQGGLSDAETKVLNDERVLDTNATDKVGQDGVEEENPDFEVHESLDEPREGEERRRKRKNRSTSLL